jgi:hypothetical protein
MGRLFSQKCIWIWTLTDITAGLFPNQLHNCVVDLGRRAYRVSLECAMEPRVTS